MIIDKLNPQGYCNGVKRAINICLEALENPNTKKPIYLLGSVIHNKYVNEEFIKKGAIILEDKNKTRYELLDQINEGTVIISAHGVSPKVIAKAKAKNLNIIDTTCPYVSIIHNNIIKYLNEGYTCLYIGTKKHPECEGILEIDSNIININNITDINNLNINNDKIYITNQTTLSIFDTSDIYNELKNKYPNAILDNKICDSTTKRQLAVINQDKVDLCIVVGDKASSNTKKLAQIANNSNINTILVENINDIKDYDFKNINTISITSGASTPSILVDEIIKYIKK